MDSWIDRVVDFFSDRVQGLKYYRSPFLGNGFSIPRWADGIYYGAECCSELIPVSEDVVSQFEFCRNNGITFHFLTPPMLVEKDLTKLKVIFSALHEAAGVRGDSVEIIFNDWGALMVIGEYRNLVPVMGRFLNGQRTDPRIGKLFDEHLKLKHEHRAHNASYKQEKVSSSSNNGFHDEFSISDNFNDSLLNASLPWMEKFLADNGVNRVEISAVPSMWQTPAESAFSLSLYLPFVPVTVTRFCPTRDFLSTEKTPNTGIYPCSRECSIGPITLKHPGITSRLILAGNAMFTRAEGWDGSDGIFPQTPQAVNRIVLFDKPV